jgi:hypothetical protein
MKGIKIIQLSFTPIFGTKEGLGLYEDDITKLKAKPGNWVEIKYKDKAISTQLREVGRYPQLNWKNDIAWIHPDDAKKLGLKGIGTSPIKPKIGFSIKVHKHRLPRSKVLYYALITLIFGIIATILTGLVQADLVGVYKLEVGAPALIFTILAMIMSALTTHAQKQ